MPGENGVLFVAKHLVHGFKAGLQASNALHLRQRLVFEIPERLVTLLHTHNVVSQLVCHILGTPRPDLCGLCISQYITYPQRLHLRQRLTFHISECTVSLPHKKTSMSGGIDCLGSTVKVCLIPRATFAAPLNLRQGADTLDTCMHCHPLQKSA